MIHSCSLDTGISRPSAMALVTFSGTGSDEVGRVERVDVEVGARDACRIDAVQEVGADARGLAGFDGDVAVADLPLGTVADQHAMGTRGRAKRSRPVADHARTERLLRGVCTP